MLYSSIHHTFSIHRLVYGLTSHLFRYLITRLYLIQNNQFPTHKMHKENTTFLHLYKTRIYSTNVHSYIHVHILINCSYLFFFFNFICSTINNNVFGKCTWSSIHRYLRFNGVSYIVISIFIHNFILRIQS